MALRIDELEEQLECNGSLAQRNNLAIGHCEVARRKSLSAHFEIFAMNAKEDAIRGLKNDIGVREVN